jgi:hypothetical protein
MIRIALLASVVLLSACPGPCTLIGCTNAVTFQLGVAVQQFGVDEAVQVRACVGSECTTEVVTKPSEPGAFGSQSFLVGTDGTLRFSFVGSIADTVSLELRKNGNVVVSESRSGVTFGKSNPNGPGCEPTCRTATVVL